MSALEPLDKLVAALGRLPGVGHRSAERMAMAIARDPERLGRELAIALQDVSARICACSRCGNITLKSEDPCRLCADPRRDDKLLCVVEDPADILVIERSGGFRGRYYALMGKLSPMKGEGVHNIRLNGLLERVGQGGIEEILLALNSDVEGDATASYIHDMLAKTGIKISRLARGIPAGSGVSYSDAVTLAKAIEGRQSF